MQRTFQKSIIQDANSRFYGIDLTECFLDAGEKIADVILKKYGVNKSYTVICGLGGNAGDGIATALKLSKKVKSLKVFLIGRSNLIEHPSTKTLWDELYTKKDEIEIRQDCYAKDIESSDIIIECLTGTGLEGNALNKRFYDVIKSISHFKSEIVAIDVPTPHYLPSLTVSINYPKTETATVVNIKFPQEVEMYIGPGEVKCLQKPKKQSHKNKNGKVLIINDLDEHCNEFIASSIKAYECSVALYNFTEIGKVKGVDKYISNHKLEEAIVEADSIFIGELPKNDFIVKGFVNELIKYVQDKPVIIFGSSLNYFDENLLKNIENKVLVFDTSSLFKFSNTQVSKIEGAAGRLSKETNSHSVVFSTQTFTFNNQGAFKIHAKNFNDYHSQLVVSSLISAFASKNSLDLASKSAVFLYSVAQKLSEKPSMQTTIKNLSDAYNECLEF